VKRRVLARIVFLQGRIILKSILHPQSHSDVAKPLYKKELEDAIELIEVFNAILDGRE